MDYYQLLNLNKKDNPDQNTITKSFRKAAMIWHPDRWSNKPLSDQKNAEKKFKEINNAYSTLSDPKKKHIYDLYGKNGNLVNNPMSRNHTNIFFNNRPFDNIFFNNIHINRNVKKIRRKIIKFTLEDFYNGCSKKIKITENNESKVISINITPGTKNNSEISYNWTNGNNIYKIIFVITQIPHDIFKREGNNLIYECNLKLEHTKKKIMITVYDLKGNEIPVIFKANEIYNNYQKVILNKGLPIIGKNNKYGDLILSFNVN